MLWNKLIGGSASSKIEFVGGYAAGIAPQTTDVTISLTSLTGGLSSSPDTNDIVIVYFCSSIANTALTVSGYTGVAQAYGNDSQQTSLGVSYKIMGSTPDTNFVLPGGVKNTSSAGAVSVLVFRNVDASTPLDVTSTTASGANTGRPNPPAITPLTSGAIIVSGGSGTNSLTVFSSSDLTGFNTAAGDGFIDAIIGAGYHRWSSGSFDPAQFGGGSTSTAAAWAAVTLALRPA